MESEWLSFRSALLRDVEAVVDRHIEQVRCQVPPMQAVMAPRRTARLAEPVGYRPPRPVDTRFGAITDSVALGRWRRSGGSEESHVPATIRSHAKTGRLLAFKGPKSEPWWWFPECQFWGPGNLISEFQQALEHLRYLEWESRWMWFDTTELSDGMTPLTSATTRGVGPHLSEIVEAARRQAQRDGFGPSRRTAGSRR